MRDIRIPLDEQADFQRWKEKRNSALRALDLEYARKELRAGMNVPDHTLLMALHKARYECLDMEPDLIWASGKWLREHGYTRLTGGPILPDGELPK